MESVLGLLDRHMCCPELSHRQISRTVGQRTVGEVQWVYREPASDVLPDALPHREKVLELQGLVMSLDADTALSVGGWTLVRHSEQLSLMYQGLLKFFHCAGL